LQRNLLVAESEKINPRMTQTEQESRAAARKPRDAAAVLFGLSSATTFTTSLLLAKLPKTRLHSSKA